MTPPLSNKFQSRVRRALRTSKPAAPKQMTEDTIHAELVARLRAAGRGSRDGSRPDLFFHTPNESRSAPQYRARLRRLGVSPGVPDLVFVLPPPCGGYVAAALEIKTESGRASKDQKRWLEVMSAHGWAVAVEYGLEACLGRLRAWGYLA